MLCGWKGNRGSGVALAMCYRLCGISIDSLSGLRKGDEHPAYIPFYEYPLFSSTQSTYSQNTTEINAWLFWVIMFTNRQTNGDENRTLPHTHTHTHTHTCTSLRMSLLVGAVFESEDSAVNHSRIQPLASHWLWCHETAKMIRYLLTKIEESACEIAG